MNQSDSITLVSIFITLIGAFIAGYPSFKPQFTKGGGMGADMGKLPLDGGRPNPDAKNKERNLRIVGFIIIAFGTLLRLVTLKFS